MEVQGCVAIVTGANRGIGEAFVRVLMQEGAAKVYAGARDPASAGHLETEFPGRVVAVALDVSKPEQITAAAGACPDVSVVINNAGAFNNQLLIGADDLSAAREEMEVNYFGPVAMARAFAPILETNGGGANSRNNQHHNQAAHGPPGSGVQNTQTREADPTPQRRGKLCPRKQACKKQTDRGPEHEEQSREEQHEAAQHQVEPPHGINHCLAKQGEPRANALKAFNP